MEAVVNVESEKKEGHHLKIKPFGSPVSIHCMNCVSEINVFDLKFSYIERSADLLGNQYLKQECKLWFCVTFQSKRIKTVLKVHIHFVFGYCHPNFKQVHVTLMT